jgi:hypothetical protein
MKPRDEDIGAVLAKAVIGIDTLWGGDIRAPSGVDRIFADSWLSDQPLPLDLNSGAAIAVRSAGGAYADPVDVPAIDRFLADVDLSGTLAELKARTSETTGGRRGYLTGMCAALGVMWSLAMEKLGRGESVPYATCVEAATGEAPRSSDPEPLKEDLAQALGRAGHWTGDLYSDVREWRQKNRVTAQRMPSLYLETVNRVDRQVRQTLLPYLPEELHNVPRANCALRPIPEAYFSGCLNYVGGRGPSGELRCDANLELNTSLDVSEAEFENLICHEVVPGHVTTFAFLQSLYYRGLVDFEASIITMNTRASCLYEGIANNALLIAQGVPTSEDLADIDLRIAFLLGLLEDAAKNQASYMTWQERVPGIEVVETLRRDFLVSPERASKIGAIWAAHPLLGRMSLPLYMFGMNKVSALLRAVGPTHLFPVLYGSRGAADIVTVTELVR